jgi:hypothetical protein
LALTNSQPASHEVEKKTENAQSWLLNGVDHSKRIDHYL